MLQIIHIQRKLKELKHGLEYSLYSKLLKMDISPTDG